MIGLIIILCFIAIIAIAIISFMCFEFKHKDIKVFCISSVVIIIFTCIASLITNLRLIEKPRAIDVYRGKTTLEITYKDNVPIDSVVVFK